MDVVINMLRCQAGGGKVLDAEAGATCHQSRLPGIVLSKHCGFISVISVIRRVEVLFQSGLLLCYAACSGVAGSSQSSAVLQSRLNSAVPVPLYLT